MSNQMKQVKRHIFLFHTNRINSALNKSETFYFIIQKIFVCSVHCIQGSAIGLLAVKPCYEESPIKFSSLHVNLPILYHPHHKKTKKEEGGARTTKSENLEGKMEQARFSRITGLSITG